MARKLEDSERAIPDFKVYDIKALIPVLKSDLRTIRRYCATGVLESEKIGGRWLICEDALKDFLRGKGRLRST